MKLKLNDKYTTISIYSVIVFVVCLLLVFILFRASAIIPYISKIMSICSPIFIGIVIAYVLNPIADFFENLLRKITKKSSGYSKIFRALSVFITFAIVIFLVSSLIASIVPELLNSIKNLLINIPDYFNLVLKTLGKLADRYPEIVDFSEEKIIKLRDDIFSQISNFETITSSMFSKKGIVSSITGGALNVLNVLKNVLIGLIIAVYLLFSKENFLGQIKKLIFAMFNHKHASAFLKLSEEANTIFSKFIIGKAIDSIIIGIITFIVLSIMGMPYVLILSFLIGITNMIPVFGPFIGAIPSCALILLSDGPQKAISFVVFIVILQQFDGNVLGPKILGNQLGVSAFWIMCSVIIGGGLFGIVGMILAVPLFVFIHSCVARAVNNKLLSKDLPIDVQDYC